VWCQPAHEVRNANTDAERHVRSIEEESLDHPIPPGERPRVDGLSWTSGWPGAIFVSAESRDKYGGKVLSFDRRAERARVLVG
jgi:hypothetical protein